MREYLPIIIVGAIIGTFAVIFIVAYLTEKSRSSVARYILQLFFVHPYLTEMEFYPQYEARMEICTGALGDAFRAAEGR